MSMFYSLIYISVAPLMLLF